MSKTITSVLLALTLAGTAHAQAPAKKPAAPKSATAAPLPLFDFKGMTAGEPVSESIFTSCSGDEDGTRSCSFADKQIAGISPIYPDYGSFSRATLYNGKLTGIEFIAEGEGFGKVLEALVARYGPPCKTETPKWQSKAGATFDNSVLTWCFRTGQLTLSQMDFKRDYMGLRYSDTQNRPPAQKPKIDF